MLDKLTEEKKVLQGAVRERTGEYLVAALGLVAGLAWNDAIKSLIEELFPIAKNTIVVKFGYAVLITVVVVIASVYIIRFIGGGEKK